MRVIKVFFMMCIMAIFAMGCTEPVAAFEHGYSHAGADWTKTGIGQGVVSGVDLVGDHAMPGFVEPKRVRQSIAGGRFEIDSAYPVNLKIAAGEAPFIPGYKDRPAW